MKMTKRHQWNPSGPIEVLNDGTLGIVEKPEEKSTLSIDDEWLHMGPFIEDMTINDPIIDP